MCLPAEHLFLKRMGCCFHSVGSKITEAAHAAQTHTVLEVFVYDSYVGGHFDKKMLHILLFCNKDNVYQIWCKDQHLILATMVAVILGKKIAHIILLS